MEAHASVADPREGGGGAGGARPPLIFAKYFKKSPKLVIIYEENLGGSPLNPGCPPLFLHPGSATVLT